MANTRVSELSPIVAADVATNDLLLLADVSAVESKKLAISDLRNYLQLNISSSSTSSWATNARTASYLLYQGFPNGTASFALTSSYNLSSSHARWADTASHALYALSASFARSSSYALTASYAHTSSVQLIFSSAFADQARTASFLLYAGVPNGTASYALSSLTASQAARATHLMYPNNSTASVAISSNQSRTASFVLYSGVPNGTASYAMYAQNIGTATTANFLNYTPGVPNGTASYAISASYARTGSYAIRAITASYAESTNADGFKRFGPFTATVNATNTQARVTISTTSSGVTMAGCNFIAEFDGDIRTIFTGSQTSKWQMIATKTDSSFSTPILGDFSSPTDAGLNISLYAGNQGITGSIRRDFFMRGQANLDSDEAFHIDLRLSGDSYFCADTRSVSVWMYSRYPTLNLAV